MARRNGDESVSDAVWMSVLSGLGAVSILGIVLWFFYLFDPIGKLIIEQHISYLLGGAVLIFVAGFGLSLQFALKMQFWRGKWK